MKKMILVSISLMMLFIVSFPAFADTTMTQVTGDIGMVPISESLNEDMPYIAYRFRNYDNTYQVVVFTKPYQNGKDFEDLYQFIDGSDVAYKNAEPFTMPSAAYISQNNRMYIPETVIKMF